MEYIIKVLSICLLILVGTITISYFAMQADIDYIESETKEARDYTLNVRTLKIHIENCTAVDNMSDRNRREVNDSISNLTGRGYIICNKCHAGLKRKNEFLAKTKTIIDNIIFGNENLDLPTKDEYLNAIYTMGNWYVENVPTYLSTLQEEELKDYVGSLTKIKNYTLKNKKYNSMQTEKIYRVLTDDKDGASRQGFTDDTKILKAKEESVVSYEKNYNLIKREKSISTYSCELLKDSKGDYKKAGDDCVRFMFSCMNSINKSFLKTLTKYTKKTWHGIGSKHIATKENEIQWAFQELGFEIFDTKQMIIDLNKNGFPEYKINKIDSNFKLQKGDILAIDGHIHFYLGNGYSDYGENFGWGHVNRDFPQTFIVKPVDINGEYYISCKDELYNRVYRYIGNE